MWIPSRGALLTVCFIYVVRALCLVLLCFFSPPYEQRWGGGAASLFIIFSLFNRPQARDWQPYKVRSSFFWLATNTPNVRNDWQCFPSCLIGWINNYLYYIIEGLGAFWFFFKLLLGLAHGRRWMCIIWSSHIARVWINRVRWLILLVVSWTGKMNISLSPFAPENMVSRDWFSRPVPRQPAHLHSQAESGATSGNQLWIYHSINNKKQSGGAEGEMGGREPSMSADIGAGR